jgi:hypothetical protein
MDNSQNQPLPPGVGTWPQAPPNHPPQFHSDPQSYHPPFDTRPDDASANGSDSAANIESAVQEAVLHAQDVETQQVIQNQRHANTTSEPTAYGEDLLSNRRDPNALKEHLLKMTADHRAEMANKRGKPLHPSNGHCFFHDNAVLFSICSSIFSCPLLERISNYDDFDLESLPSHEDILLTGAILPIVSLCSYEAASYLLVF